MDPAALWPAAQYLVGLAEAALQHILKGQAGSAVEPADKTQDENAAAASEESADAESAGEDGNESGKDGKALSPRKRV